MCDYSLHLSPTRLAKEGEQLVVHRFPGGSLGMASPAELQPAEIHRKLTAPRAWTWAGIAHYFRQLNQDAPVVAAVCVPPGARLVLQDVPAAMQKELQVSSEERVVFDQMTADAYAYRDCIRFENGRRVSLQTLRPGQRLKIVSLSPAGEPERVYAEPSTAG
jgi:hypothetical protein